VKDGIVHSAVAGKDLVAGYFTGAVHYIKGDKTPEQAAKEAPAAKQEAVPAAKEAPVPPAVTATTAKAEE
jgi:hypothetical protein